MKKKSSLVPKSRSLITLENLNYVERVKVVLMFVSVEESIQCEFKKEFCS